MEKTCILTKLAATLAEFTKQNSLSYDEVIEYCQTLKRKSTIDWTSILFADWHSPLVLQYLTLKDIAKLDTAMCNRNGRKQWLESLEKYISSVSLKDLAWSDVIINWIILRHLRFEELSITQRYLKISNEGMYRLAQHCPNLKKLKIKYDKPIVDDKRIQYLTAICYKLESVELLDDYPLSSVDFVGLGACELLESVKLHVRMSAASIKPILTNKKKLKCLQLRINVNVEEVTNEILLDLGTHCPLLEYLSVPRLQTTSEQIDIFTKGCNKLKYFKVYNGMADASLIDKVIESLGKNCKLLEKLCFKSEHVMALAAITESALTSLALGCPSLNTLRLEYIHILPAQAVKQLANHCLLLSDVSFTVCNISDDVLVELGESKCLKTLTLVQCEHITNTGIEALVKTNGHHLQSLDIRMCTRLSDASLFSLSDHCPNLHTITVGYNHDELTLVGLVRLIQKCRKLVNFINKGTINSKLIEVEIEKRRHLLC